MIIIMMMVMMVMIMVMVMLVVVGAADDDDNDGDDEEEEDDNNFDDLDKTSVRRRWVASRPETWRFIPNKEPTKYSIPFGKLT